MNITTIPTAASTFIPRDIETARRQRYATDFPAISTSDYWGDRVVTQGHADYCRDYGHATHTVDGVVSPRCPRCGDNAAPESVAERATVACDVMPAHPVYGEPRKPRLGEVGLIAPLDDNGAPRQYPVIEEVQTPLARMSRMADGTYLQDRAGVWHDYAARWSYGYIVAIRPATDADIEEPYNLIGVWKNPESGHVYVDLVEHVSDIDTALERARERGEISIYQLFPPRVIYVED